MVQTGMTKYYYYDDPIKAAWMAKEHGIKFIDKSLNEYAEDHRWEAFFSWGACLEEDNFYVHPDSYDVFEPRTGDTVGWVNGTHQGCLHEYHEGCREEGEGHFIIQRQGKAFFNPLVEKVSE